MAPHNMRWQNSLQLETNLAKTHERSKPGPFILNPRCVSGGPDLKKIMHSFIFTNILDRISFMHFQLS